MSSVEQGAAPDAAYSGAYTDEYVDLDGLRIHYTDWNPQASRHVVMIHGLSVQAHTWDPIAAELARDYHVICPDLRGHGESGWARDGYRIENFVSDLEGLVHHLGLEQIDIVSHSLGCRIAIVYAARHPETVERLVLSDAGPEVPKKAAEFTKRVVSGGGKDVKGFRTEEEVTAYYRELHPEWQEEFIRLHARHQVRRNWANRLIFRADPDLFWLLGGTSLKDDPLVWEHVDGLTMPSLILWGKTSPFFTEELAQRMLERMASGSLISTDTGHYIPREAPEEFVRIVRGFLAESGSSPAA